MINQERLKQVFSYDKDSGIFTHLRSYGRVKKGDIPVTKDNSGYLLTSVDGKKYRQHQLAFLYVYGFMPKEIDHINGNKADNRISNLREVNRSQNNQNHKNLRKNNKTGFRGVSVTKNGKFLSRIYISGKSIDLGVFDNAESASIEYKKASLIHHECSYLLSNGEL